MQIITAYKNFLIDRGLSEEICQAYGLQWMPDGRLAIPVKDFNNKFLFNKYRRNPYLTDGPKYTYDAGSKSSLFGAQALSSKDVHGVVVCEGELDALLISDKFTGYHIVGVSSTGGCGTWKEEWNEMLKDKQVFICYDSDPPGVIGAMKVHKKIPGSKIMFLPNNIKLHPKDTTELFQMLKHDVPFKEVFHQMMHHSYIIPEKMFTTESVLEGEKKDIQRYWLQVIQELNKTKTDNYWAKIILEHSNNLKTYSAITKKLKSTGAEDVGVAKNYKITDLLKFSKNKAKCIWHKDDSPSLTYYPHNNTVYCFGCQRAGDAIDVYMQIHSTSFKEAVKALNSA